MKFTPEYKSWSRSLAMIGKCNLVELLPFISAVSVVSNIFWFRSISSITGFPYLGVITISDYLSIALTVTSIPVIYSLLVSIISWAVFCGFTDLHKNERLLSVKSLIITIPVCWVFTLNYARLNAGILYNEKDTYRAYLKKTDDLEFFVGLTNGILLKKHNQHTLVFYPWSVVKSIESRK